MKRSVVASLLITTALSGFASHAHAQSGVGSAVAPATDSSNAAARRTAAQPGGVGLEEVVVTARANPLTKLRTSISVTTLNAATIAQAAPSSAADILRNVPGIRAEASGGEGNANISVRGLPVASGGAKFVQFQEDGLPILQFGDIDFSTADQFLRYDGNVARLEVVRGGSASTFASDAPGAIFNFISKTGDAPGGSISTTQGLNYAEHRYDFDYGNHVGDWSYHFGGFYRNGDGPRTANFQTENGGQFKGNVTRHFDDGSFIRLNFKYLNDTSPAYLPIPIGITGDPSNPHVFSLPGFSAQNGTLLTPALQTDHYYDHNGNPQTASVSDGYHSVEVAGGAEASFKLGGGFAVDDKFRIEGNNGDFLGVYPASVGLASGLAQSVGGAGASLRYATGSRVGQAYDPNAQAVQDTLFNTTLNNLNEYVNDLKLTKTVDIGDIGKLDLAGGYFHSTQNIVEDWHWNSYLEGAIGKDAPLLDVVGANGNLLTSRGLVGYNAGFGFCCARYYDLQYGTDAPYISAGLQHGPFNVDASLRYDFASASGNYSGGGAIVQLPTGNPAVPTLPGKLVDPSTALPVNYTKRYLSYSFGVNYLVEPGLGLFARTSQGGRANAERILFGAGVLPDGSVPQDVAIDVVRQTEGGVKWKIDNFDAFATAFYAHTAETNFDITQRLNPLISRTYEAEGLELQTDYHYGPFRISGGATYTHSRIVADQITPGDVGNVPQRQAEFVYQITPGYYTDLFNAGVNIIGTTSSYADSTNVLAMPGYDTVNLFANWNIRPDLALSFNVNNLFNAIGITEIDANPNAQGVALARTINGRTIKAGLSYSF